MICRTPSFFYFPFYEAERNRNNFFLRVALRFIERLFEFAIWQQNASLQRTSRGNRTNRSDGETNQYIGALRRGYPIATDGNTGIGKD
jgi:hypothetical protein